MKTIIVFPIYLLFLISPIVLGQSDSTNKKTKCDFVISLIESSNPTEVRIVAANFVKSYNKEWLSDIKVENGLITFRKGNSIHYWDIENAIFIAYIDGMLDIRLSTLAGD